MDNGREIGRRLVQAFEKRGIPSKKAMSEALGFKSENAVYKVISGERELDFDGLIRFAQRTGHSVDWLLTGKQSLEQGEYVVYFGEEEERIIGEFAAESKRTFEDEVREQLIEHLEEKGKLTTKTGESNLVFLGDHANMISLPFYGEIAAGQPLMIVERSEAIDVPTFRRDSNKQYMVLRARGDSMIEERIYDGSLLICEVRKTAQKGETIVAVIDGESATVKKYFPERGRIRLQPANPAHIAQYVTDDRLDIQGIVVGIFHKPS